MDSQDDPGLHSSNLARKAERITNKNLIQLMFGSNEISSLGQGIAQISRGETTPG